MIDFLFKVGEWLVNEPASKFWLGSGFSFIFAIFVLAGIIACIFSKKLRNMFF